LREYSRNKALAESVINDIIDGGGRDAEPACRIAVDVYISLQPLIL